jgi:DNA (cytosine-5)-methyltransferase 1
MTADLTYGSVCSGIEGASVAWAPLRWRCAFMAETEAFPRAVLKHHYPDVPLFSDFTLLRDHQQDALVDVDLLVGGTPCQGFSIAGLRGSLSDDRSNLCLEFIRLANTIDDLRRAAGRPPLWVLWENVPGVFSTEDNAFGAFLGGLVGCDAALDPGARGKWTDAGLAAGPDRMAAWRVLDAQHFGLAQRRRRVFVLALGGAGAWRCADALLPLADSLQGYPAPRREARERAARPIAGSSPASSGYRNDADTADNLIAFGGNNTSGEIDVTAGLLAQPGSGWKGDFDSETFITHSLRADGFDASEDGTGRGTPLVASTLRPPSRDATWRGDGCDNLIAGVMPAIAFNWQNGGGYGEAHDGLGITEDGTGPLDASTIKAVAIPITIDAARRGEGTALTPSPDADGRVRLRDPGLGIGEDGDPAGTLQAAGPGAVFTLASRGRGDGHQLEFRDDGLANAVLTPSGGRAGIGVGAVAIADMRIAQCARTGGPLTGWCLGEQRPDGLWSIRCPDCEDLREAAVTDLIPFDAMQLTHPENRANPQPGDPAPTLAKVSRPMVAAPVDLQNLALGGDIAGTLDTTRPTRGGGQAVAFTNTPSQSNKDFNARPSERTQALTPNGNRVSARGGDVIMPTSAVRRLTPTECERLQGFPDGYTDVPFRGKAAADGPRYKALGNSFAAPVIRWIGERIASVNQR